TRDERQRRKATNRGAPSAEARNARGERTTSVGQRLFVGYGVTAFFLRTHFLGAAAFGGFNRQNRMAALGAAFRHRQVPDGILAVGITRARIEDFSVARFALEHAPLFAFGTWHAGVFRFLERLHVFAVRIVAATDELAVTPALDDEVRSALGAHAPLDDFRLVRGARGVIDVTRVVAIGIAGATDEVTVAPEPLGQPLAALRTILFEHLDTGSLHAFLLLHLNFELAPKLLQYRTPLFLAARDGVEIVLHMRGELVVHVVVEMLGEEFVDDAPDVGRFEAALIERRVLAPHQRINDAGVGRGTADAVGFERLDQARFAEARRR